VLQQAGVKKKELKNEETARVMYQLIQDHLAKVRGVCVFGASFDQRSVAERWRWRWRWWRGGGGRRS
jgi:hypothetical protein